MRETAQFFKTLGDEARLQILWLLSNHGELCVCDVVAVLRITQSKASRHLLTLRHAGLVTGRREGLWSYYSLRPVADELSRQHLALLRRTLARRPDAEKLLARLQRWLEAKPRTPCAGKGGTLHKPAGGRR